MPRALGRRPASGWQPQLGVGAGGARLLGAARAVWLPLLYGAYVAWRSPASRALFAGLAVLAPAAWLLPSWVGSGDLLAAGAQARSEPSWSLSLAPEPWRAALAVAQGQAWLVLELTALVAVALALVARGGASVLPRPARPGAVAVMAGFGAAVAALYVVMTEAGFSGNPRYVLPALIAISVLGGVGAGLIVDLGRRIVDKITPRASVAQLRGGAVGAAAAGAVLLAAAAPEVQDHVKAADAEAREAIERARLHDQLELAVDTLGADYLTRFGPTTTNRSYQTHLAWELSLSISDVHATWGRGIVLRAPAEPVAGVVRIYRRARPRVTLARVGSWTISARPPSARHVFTWPIVGFDLRAAAARHRPGRPASVAVSAERDKVRRAGEVEAS